MKKMTVGRDVPEELAGENEVARFFRNHMTRSVDDYASEIGLKCLLAERKDGTKKEYVLLDRKQNPIQVSTNYEQILVFVDVRKRLSKPKL